MNDNDTAEAEERAYLADTMQLLRVELERVTASIDSSHADIEEQKQFMWSHRRDMDGSEKASMRTMVDMSVSHGENAVKAREQLNRLLGTPYFGRVDFRTADDRSTRPFYIGVHSFRDVHERELRVHDWRAPVSSLYYDFESGEASFLAPEGEFRGEITGKRQYKIRGGQLEYMLESGLNIGDDVLQRELSQSADDKMKNIVATIQREQNAVIRNETAQVLILQGVAGSGKTSIALHRVAFLLYRFKDTLTSDNVMILSPNRIFGDYIANVLPELGEEQITEIDFDRIADTFLAKVTGYQTFSEQVVDLLEHVDDGAAERMRYKATPEFVEALNEWIRLRSVEDFTAREIEHKYGRLSTEWVLQNFATLKAVPMFTRLERLGDSAIHLLKQEALGRSARWSAADSLSVQRQVKAMFRHADALALYKAFYLDPARRDLFVPLGQKKIEFADVFPLVLTIIRTTRQEGYGRIRHLLVDEMQDYTPVQYAVLRSLFSCRMTILGDANQSVNPFSSSTLSTIHSIFPEADCLELCKSYRSTSEITGFAQNISRNDKLIPIERHGPHPEIVQCSDESHEVERVRALVENHRASDHESLGIICKTVAQAEALYRELTRAGVALTFLDYSSSSFATGIVITSAHISKGLEFDVVIVPSVSDANYVSEMDKSMLYIACTRAMHELHLTYCGSLSPFFGFTSQSKETLRVHDRVPI